MTEPRPAKPWYRPRNVVLVVLGVIVFLIGREVYLAFTAVPGSSVNYAAKMAELVDSYQPAAPDVDDAWPLVRQAIEIEYAERIALVPPSRSRTSLDYSAIGGPPPGTPLDESARAIYAGTETWADVEARAREGVQRLEERGLFEVLARLAEAPRVTRPVRPDEEGHLIGMILLELGPKRNMARVLKGRMIMAREQRDWPEVAAAHDQALALGRIAAHQGFLIDYLVGMAIHSLANGEVRVALTEGPAPDAETLRALLTSMRRQALPPFELALRGERISLDDTIQWIHSDDGRGSGRLLWMEYARAAPLWRAGAWGPGAATPLGRLGAGHLANLAGVFFASKRRTLNKADEYFALVTRRTAVRPFERHQTPDPEAFVENLPARYILLREVLPSCNDALRSLDVAECLAAGTRVQVAVELFRAEHARYPGTLEELAPSILPAPPVDPINGKAYGYRLVPPGSDPHGRAYLLYSFGADGEDNAGRRTGRNAPSAALFLPTGRGYDYIFSEPRYMPEDAPPQPEEAPTPEDEPHGDDKPAPAAPPSP